MKKERKEKKRKGGTRRQSKDGKINKKNKGSILSRKEDEVYSMEV